MSTEKLISIAQKVAKLKRRMKLKDTKAYPQYIEAVKEYTSLIREIKNKGEWNGSISIMLEQIGESV